MTHPYKGLPDYQFWQKAVSDKASGNIDPVITSMPITKIEKISTMGSCFSQHLSQNIKSAGFNYFVPESGPKTNSEAELINRNFGVFSARYGNIYTVRQAIQLFDRAFGLAEFQENIWTRERVFLDAFRPNIEPSGFECKESLINDRISHLNHVRTVFLESNWLMFTLGLTETWRSKIDNTIYPVCPGVAGGSFNKEEHEFINLSVFDVINDLQIFIKKCHSVNSNLKILLTVSPVPLIATYENRHVLTSTTISKSILLTAVDVIVKEFENIIYFPSYEIITSPANEGRYYCDDLRNVKNIGVTHVMNLFSRHFLNNGDGDFPQKNHLVGQFISDVVCDEDLIFDAINIARVDSK